MDIPLQVTFRNTKHSPALEEAIRQQAAKLEHFHPHVVSCRAVLEQEGRHHQQGKAFVLRLDIKTGGGGEIAVNREAAEEPLVAVNEAFHAARRQLEDLARRQRGDVKRHA